MSTQCDSSSVRFAVHRPSLFSLLGEWIAASRQRRALADLDSHRLNDIGISREEALNEARRLPWDAPSHWHR